MPSKVLSELRLYICNEWIGSIPSRRLRLWYYKKIMRFDINAGVSIFMHCKFQCAEGLSLGMNCIVNSNCHLDSRGGLKIGNKVGISQDVVILTADHDVNTPFGDGRSRTVVIEDLVWIGTRAMILPGVTIGKGAVVAAGSVVTRNVSEFSIVAGVPAKVIGSRNTDLRYDNVYSRFLQ